MISLLVFSNWRLAFVQNFTAASGKKPAVKGEKIKWPFALQSSSKYRTFAVPTYMGLTGFDSGQERYV
ncbi:MAG: hypothetical protein WCJ95_16010, partial [Mariniphaga sp.]